MKQGQVIPDFLNSPTDGRVSWEQALTKMVNYMAYDTEADYEVLIGTDSEAQNGSVNFVSAVIVRRCGKGGIYFWSRGVRENIFSLHQRMQMEALSSLAIAQRVTEEFVAIGLAGLNLGIHLDIGPNGPTKDLISELEGMIKANGYRVATKPSAWAASHVADRHV